VLCAGVEKHCGAQLRIGARAHYRRVEYRATCRAVLPSGVKAQIDLASWPVPPIFKYLAKVGKIDGDELLHSFNMGVGMILVVPPAQREVCRS